MIPSFVYLNIARIRSNLVCQHLLKHSDREPFRQHERFREFGVMLSIGMSNFRLALTTAIEMVFMVVIGFVIGNIAGAAINYYFMKHPIVLGGSMGSFVHEWGFQPIVPSSLSPGIFLTAGTIVLAISVMAAIYPLWRVSRLEPLKGIRYT